MSDRRIVLSAEARADMKEILRFTQETWGRDQRTGYSRVIHDALRNIGRLPDIGIARPEIDSGTRSMKVSRHTILDDVLEDRIVVTAIVHDREQRNRKLSAHELMKIWRPSAPVRETRYYLAVDDRAITFGR